jgi:YggT family protein
MAEATTASTVFSSFSSPQLVATLADLDPSTAATLALVLRPLFSVAELLFIVRIVLTWYPAVDGDKLPWAVVIKPTEPFLVGTRKVVPPLAGVDVSPVVWVALLSFVSEILVGPQGILILLSRKVGGA